ncbi:MAG: ATP-binding protein [Candidatus Aenigmatarchaeota archaeon]
MIEVQDNIVGYLNTQLAVASELAKNYTTDPATGGKFLYRPIYYRLFKAVSNFVKPEGVESRLIIIPGLRGVGKTTLLFQIFERFQNAKNTKFLYLSCDRLVEFGVGLQEVLSVYENKFLGGPLETYKGKLILLIDEAHYDKSWSLVIKTVYDRSKNVMILVSGSSAIAFGMTTDLVRRAKTEWLFPLRFMEYVLFKSAKTKNIIYPPAHTADNLQNALFLTHSANEAYSKLVGVIKETRTQYLSKIPSLQSDIEQYMLLRGFPFTISEVDESVLYEKTLDILRRVIEEDLPLFSDVGKKTISKAFSILSSIACNKGGGVSIKSIAANFSDISETSVFRLFEGLEKAGVLFPVKPYGGPEKIANAAWKYYFATPVLQAALMWRIGKLDKTSETLGPLLETSVANTLWRINVLQSRIISGLYYDYKKGGADFIAKTPNGLVVIESGWGDKPSRQVKQTMESVSAYMGIIISGSAEKINENMITLPKEIMLLA